MRNYTLITVQDFSKTREVKMSQFKEIWNRGGFYSDSNFANGDTALYLRIECDAIRNDKGHIIAVTRLVTV